jgi:hypothetical protein
MMRHKENDVLLYKNLTKLFMAKLVQENEVSINYLAKCSMFKLFR